MSERDLDVVVHGATGFVGRLTAQHLAEAAPADLRIGLSGRSSERLEAVRRDLPAVAAEWPLLVVDSHDDAALDDLARRTHVVATTVGPYARHGRGLVAACAAAGTHYADITGEVLFVRDMIDAHHDTAAASGARIVHACGFDSIPSDLGVLSAHEHAVAHSANGADSSDLTEVTLVVVSARGGVSGGTIDSLRNQVDEMRADPASRRVVTDPYALNPPGRRGTADDPDEAGVRRDAMLGKWTAPFVMSAFNTRIVRRSNALLDHAYGAGMRYREVVAFPAGPLGPIGAGAVTLGLWTAVGAMALPPTRAVLDRVLPSPGEGPGAAARQAGHFRVDVHALTRAGAHIVATVAADADPGYGATSLMLGESALCLAADADRLPDRAGVLTPATAMGSALRDRLRAAGMTISAAPG